MFDFPLFPESASTIAGEVDAVFFFNTAVSVFFSTLIFLLIFYFALKYRRRSAAERPRAIVGSLRLELLWTIVPLIIALFMFAWGAKIYFDIYIPPPGTTNIYVVGKQWMWKIQHPEGNREINELHVPTGVPIKLILTSEDVIHSFYVPAFRIKMDVLPGRYTTVWFEATKPGRYHLFCAEYCGTKHSQMIGSVYVMDPRDYENWLNSGRLVQSMAEEGETLFSRLGCQTCHISEAGIRGPSLNGLVERRSQLMTGETVEVTDQYLRESILEPNEKIVAGYGPMMPTYQGQVSEEELLQLIAYIKSLRGNLELQDSGRQSTDNSSLPGEERITNEE